MKITTTSKLVGGKVSEASAFTVIVSYFDDTQDAWTAAAPTSARYRIDRVTSDPSCWEQVLDWTTLSPATSNSILVTGAQNTIIDDCSYLEPRQILIEANAGLSTQFQHTFRYSVQNLAGQS